MPYNLDVGSGVMGGMRAAAVAIVLLAAGCSGASSSPIVTPHRTAPSAAPAATAFSADPSALGAHGELAAVDAGRLYLIGAPASGTREVAIPGRVAEPVWSYDGRWLAVVSSPRPPKTEPYVDEPTTVWLVTPAGQVVRRLTPSGHKVGDAALAWSPTTDRLAVTYRLRGMDHVAVAAPSGASTVLLRAPQVSWLAWSPDGASLAIGRNRFVKPVTGSSWRSEIDVLPAGGGRPKVITRDTGGIYDVAGWWPDGSGVLAWIDPMGSGSIAADGLPLYDFALDGSRRLLGDTLQYRPWISMSKLRDEAVLIVGGDRELTNAHKHLVVCTRTRCHPVAQPKTAVTFDPAFAPDGRLGLVRDRAIAPSQSSGAFGATYTAKVDASGGTAVLHGRSVRPLSGGLGASAPVWGGDGSLLMVKDRSLWLLAAGSPRPLRVAGPIGLADPFDSYYPGDPGWYYGFVGWWDTFAWSKATTGIAQA